SSRRRQSGVREAARSGAARARRLPGGPPGPAPGQARCEAAARAGGEGASQGPRRRARSERAAGTGVASAGGPWTGEGARCETGAEGGAGKEAAREETEVILLALLAFSWMPLEHGLRPSRRPGLHDPPFFVGEMQHIVPQGKLPFSPTETATPVLDSAQTRLYVGTRDGKVRCRFRGRTAWIFQTSGAVLASPAIEGETLYVAGGDGVVYALNRFADGVVAALQPENGVANWTRQVSGTGDYLDVDWIEAPEADTRIYVASAKAGIVALDAATGNPAWTYPLAGANHVVVEGARVVGGGRGELVALDRSTGVKLWTLQLGKDRYPTQPVAVGGLIIVAQDRGALMGVDLQTGATRGAFDPGSGFSQPVYALPGIAFVLSNGGTLFSLGLLP